MIGRRQLLPFAILAAARRAPAAEPPTSRGPIATADLFIRDPFVVPVPDERRYYLFGTGGRNKDAPGFNAYLSRDLATWEVRSAFDPPEGGWADRDYGAPKVHPYHGAWYLFFSHKTPAACRATQILVAASPGGPYRPHSQSAVTPRDWECLGGTLYVGEAGVPWLVFCHEGDPAHGGAICARRLAPDLASAAGRPLLLFKASEAPWAPREKALVADGLFLHRAANGHLLLLWSGNGEAGPTLGVARSRSGSITGPWTHDPDPIRRGDGGHGMLFTTFDGRLHLALHAPNGGGRERARFIPVREEEGRLVVAADARR